jgi:hypothetical protein
LYLHFYIRIKVGKFKMSSNKTIRHWYFSILNLEYIFFFCCTWRLSRTVFFVLKNIYFILFLCVYVFIHEKLNTPQLFPFKHVHALLIPLIIRILQIFFFLSPLSIFIAHWQDSVRKKKRSLAVPLHFDFLIFFYSVRIIY